MNAIAYGDTRGAKRPCQRSASTSLRFEFERFFFVLNHGLATTAARSADIFGMPSSDLPNCAPPLETPYHDACGVVTIDAGALFSSIRTGAQSTPILPGSRGSSALGVARPVVEATAPASVAKAQPEAAHELPPELTIDYGFILKRIHESSYWSWRELSSILGVSHTQLQRVARGVDAGYGLGRKIQDLGRFLSAAQQVTRNNRIALLRALEIPRERDGITASDQLRDGQFSRAFSAIMDAVSRRPEVADAAPVPLRWYNEPSRATYEDAEEEGAG
jgi:hypothetical protein